MVLFVFPQPSENHCLPHRSHSNLSLVISQGQGSLSGRVHFCTLCSSLGSEELNLPRVLGLKLNQVVKGSWLL